MPPTQKDHTAVVPASFFSALGARLVKNLGPNAAELMLYDIGREVGRSFVQIAEGYLDVKMRTEADVRTLIAYFDTEFRWARIALESVDMTGKFAVVEWRDGIGVPKGGSKAPVCHLGRGLLSGAAEIVFQTNCDALETQCQAMGADHCRIVVGNRDRIAEVAETLG